MPGGEVILNASDLTCKCHAQGHFSPKNPMVRIHPPEIGALCDAASKNPPEFHFPQFNPFIHLNALWPAKNGNPRAADGAPYLRNPSRGIRRAHL